MESDFSLETLEYPLDSKLTELEEKVMIANRRVSELQDALNVKTPESNANQQEIQKLVDKNKQLQVYFENLESENSLKIKFLMFNNSTNQDLSAIEKLREDFAHATKAKVDLLKELSKTHKETERMKHAHHDQVNRLEREVESLQNEINKLHTDQASREVEKLKARDDYERKLKNQDSNVQKLKSKIKDLEKELKLGYQSRKPPIDTNDTLEKTLSTTLPTLRRKLKEEQDKVTMIEAKKQKETMVLNKQLQEERQRIVNLETKLSELESEKIEMKTTIQELLDQVSQLKRNEYTNENDLTNNRQQQFLNEFRDDAFLCQLITNMVKYFLPSPTAHPNNPKFTN